MSKVIVTGGCGFIGSALVDQLVECGKEVVVVDNLCASTHKHENKKATYLCCDISEMLEERYATILQGAERIFHLAAQSRIQPSFAQPLLTAHSNCYGSTVVCEWARQQHARVIYAGSSSFYGGVYLNPYAFSKWQGEEVCRMYSEVFGVSTAIARFFNVFGPRSPRNGQYAPVIGIFEDLHRRGEALTIVGDGEQRRDFIHVGDVAAGLIAMSQHNYKGKIFNIGSGTNYSINEIAMLFGDATRHLPARPGEARNTLADILETVAETGWRPRRDVCEYIREFVKRFPSGCWKEEEGCARA